MKILYIAVLLFQQYIRMLGFNIPEILYIFNDLRGYFYNDELVCVFHKQVKSLTA